MTDNENDFVERRDPKACSEHLKIMHDHTTRLALLEQSVVHINKSVDSINANVAKLIWIVVSGIGASVVAWLLKGGLHV